MQNRFRFSAAATLLLVAFAGWSRAVDQAEPVDEATKLAMQLSDAMHNQDAGAATELLDGDALMDRIAAGTEAPAELTAGFKQGFAAPGLMGQIIKAAGPDGYHFLRTRQVNGQTHVLFRLLRVQGGLNYHDWIVEKDTQGNLRLVDVYIAATGELFSQTARRPFLQAVVAANPGFMDRLRGRDKDRAANISKLEQMGEAALKADAQSAQKLLDIYKQLPKAIQEDKTCMILRLAASQKLMDQSPQEYQLVMAEYMRLFPGDPSTDLVCMDAYLPRQQFAEARQAMSRLERFTGGDPYLDVVRGTSYLKEGGDANAEEAKRLFEKAIEQEPKLAQAYWSLVLLSLKAKQYDQTAAVLTRIENDLHMPINDLAGMETYDGFVKSEAYKKWMAGRRTATPTVPPEE